jgi:tetratricopeptide (TPR) repeat protein
MDKSLLKAAKSEVTVSIFLLLATLAIFLQTVTFDFVTYDDPDNIYENPYVKDGFSLRSFWWAFSSGGKLGDYNPLTWLTHMIDCEMYGIKPAGHHFTNVLFHVVNAIFLFVVLRILTNTLWQSAFVAALFAVHPLHVESVAWVTERRDVLYGFFWILAIGAYIRYARYSASVVRYIIVVLAFAASLLSKSMAVTLPFVLLLLDYWPLERISVSEPSVTDTKVKCHRSDIPKASLTRLIAEKIPFFVMSAVICAVTYTVNQRIGTISVVSRLPIASRIDNALVSYIKYILMMMWPKGLAVLYPHPISGLPKWQPVISFLILVAVSAAVIYAGRRRRYLAVGWFWYLGTLFPTIGIIQAGAQAYADRYSYIPLIGLFIIIAWGLPDLLAKWRYKRILLSTSAVIVVLALSICSFFQTRYWKDSITLFQHAVDVTRNNSQMHYNLGTALTRQGRLDEAIVQFRKAVKIKSEYPEAHFNLANALREQGSFDEAVNHYQLSLLARPDNAEAHNNLAIVLKLQGKTDEAIHHYHIALKINPEYARAYNNLGSALLAQNKLDEAIDSFRRALQIDPNYTTAQRNLDVALSLRNKPD